MIWPSSSMRTPSRGWDIKPLRHQRDGCHGSAIVAMEITTPTSIRMQDRSPSHPWMFLHVHCVEILSGDSQLQAEPASDDVALDLRSARPYRRQPRVAEEALHRVVHAVAVAAEYLQPQVGNRLVG